MFMKDQQLRSGWPHTDIEVVAFEECIPVSNNVRMIKLRKDTDFVLGFLLLLLWKVDESDPFNNNKLL